MVVRVLPDQTGITRTFDYLVPPEWADRVTLGTRVRISLGPRRVGAWVVALDVTPPTGLELRPIAKVTGHGPPSELLDLSVWAQWRWAAKTPVPFLRTASPERAVTALPARPSRRHPVPPASDDVVQGAFASESTIVRLPPVADLVPVVQAAASLGDPLILCASRAQADQLGDRLVRAGVPTARYPHDWAAAAAGGSAVVGTRAAAWAPVPDLAAIVVIDEHDEVHQEERSPTWHVREVAIERARRRGVPCVLTSPMPTLEAQATSPVVTLDRTVERNGWPKVVVVDRRDEDTGRNALFSPALVDIVRSGAATACVLNQKGRAALLACASCGDVARCARCQAAVHRPGDDELVCRRCGEVRPVICAGCGATAMRTIRMGVSRVRDDLEALAGEPVAEVTADTPDDTVRSGRLWVGTEAVLHRVPKADVVAFLDLDQELFAPRYRAAEEALGLLVRAARMVGDRRSGGRLVLQTRSPEHEVVQAALEGDPAAVAQAERARRQDFGFPPFGAIAEIGDQAGEAFVDALRSLEAAGIEIRGPVDGSWQVRASDHRTLCDALAAVERPAGRLRLSIDPPRI
jgi:primosomal protein N' (replication factor Y)